MMAQEVPCPYTRESRTTRNWDKLTRLVDDGYKAPEIAHLLKLGTPTVYQAIQRIRAVQAEEHKKVEVTFSPMTIKVAQLKIKDWDWSLKFKEVWASNQGNFTLQQIQSLGLSSQEQVTLIKRSLDPVSYTHLTLPTTPYV